MTKSIPFLKTLVTITTTKTTSKRATKCHETKSWRIRDNLWWEPCNPGGPGGQPATGGSSQPGCHSWAARRSFIFYGNFLYLKLVNDISRIILWLVCFTWIHYFSHTMPTQNDSCMESNTQFAPSHNPRRAPPASAHLESWSNPKFILSRPHYGLLHTKLYT